MRLSISFICVGIALTIICVSCDTRKNYEADLQAEVDSLRAVTIKQETAISELKDSVSILKFPADQRLAEIKD